jgi:Fe-Mn family superoxide dismutase
MFYRESLLYSLNSLEPFIDTPTMDEHYNVHYKKYAEGLNDAIAENDLFGITIEELLKKHHNIKKIRNNGGGFYNHLLYFKNLSPYGDFATSDYLKNAIESNFGSFQNFKSQFIQAGSSVFGSGWAWLILHENKLKIATTSNQDNPIMTLDCKILLGMDVWEHAYYLKHKANRKGYMDDFFSVINWKVVSERYEIN